GGGNDTITLSAAGTYVLNIQNVETVNGTGGSDDVTLGNAATGLTLNLGLGSDTLTLANGTNHVSVQNVETVTGGTGADFVTLNADVGATTVTASFDLGGGSDQLTLNVFGTPIINLALNNVETVNSTGGIETVNLANAANGLSIDLGGGFDTWNLASGNNVGTVSSVETLTASGAGNDTITFIADSLVVNQSIDLGGGIMC